MTTIKDLKGYCHPLTVAGRAALCGAPPWHYATEYLNVAYRTDPAAIAACLPEPLARRGPSPIALTWPSVSGGRCGTIGTRLKAYVCAHGERLIEGTMAIERRIRPTDLPAPMGLPIFNIRHFPSAGRAAPAAVLELLRLGAQDLRYGPDLWAGQRGSDSSPRRSSSTCRSRLSRCWAPTASAPATLSRAPRSCTGGYSGKGIAGRTAATDRPSAIQVS